MMLFDYDKAISLMRRWDVDVLLPHSLLNAGYLADHCPDLELRDHQVTDALIARQVKYYGEAVDLRPVVDVALEPMADQVISQATQLWNSGAGLDAILVSGGGALLLGPYIKGHFRHARVVSDPVFANALGYWRFAQRLSG